MNHLKEIQRSPQRHAEVPAVPSITPVNGNDNYSGSMPNQFLAGQTLTAYSFQRLRSQKL